MITEGGVFKNAVRQVPRVILPTVPTFDFNDDEVALQSGIPYGGLYNSGGFIRIQQSENIALQVVNAGSGYNEGDVYTTTASTGSGSGLTILVDEITSGSGIDTFSVVDPGSDYTAGDSVSLDVGGATLTVTVGNDLQRSELITDEIKFNSLTSLGGYNWSVYQDTSSNLKIDTVDDSKDLIVSDANLVLTADGLSSNDIKVTKGDVRIEQAGNGLVLTSPDGTEYIVSVNNSGTLDVDPV